MKHIRMLAAEAATKAALRTGRAAEETTALTPFLKMKAASAAAFVRIRLALRAAQGRFRTWDAEDTGTYLLPFQKIDRWHSRPLDVHVWSEHPEAKRVSLLVYEEIGGPNLESPTGKQPRLKFRDHCQVLVLDLYVSWLEDPNQAIGIHFDKSAYVVGSRYNKLFVSDKVITIAKLMIDHGYLEVVPGVYDREDLANSYVTRIRPTAKLIQLFLEATIPLTSIRFDHRETVVLRKKKGRRNVDVEYKDTDETVRMRAWNATYNACLGRHSIDIPSVPGRSLTYQTTDKRGRPMKVTVSLGPKGKCVHRVFSRERWDLNGRIVGGFWQLVPKEYRRLIYIDGEPTVEVDFSGLHVNMLSLKRRVPLEGDVYDVVHIPSDHYTPEQQRDVVKSLILMSINAKSAKEAFNAFRDDKRGTPLQRLKDRDLRRLLNAFMAKHPHLKDDLCTDKGIGLMYEDSCMAEEIITHFVMRDIPILCVHDSFVVQERYEAELKRVMLEVSFKHLNGRLTVKAKKHHDQIITPEYQLRLQPYLQQPKPNPYLVSHSTI